MMILEVTADLCSITTYTKKYDGYFKITYHYVSELVGGLFCFRSTFISGKTAKDMGQFCPRKLCRTSFIDLVLLKCSDSYFVTQGLVLHWLLKSFQNKNSSIKYLKLHKFVSYEFDSTKFGKDPRQLLSSVRK